MKFIKSFLLNSYLQNFVISLIALIFAITSQYLFDLKPCILCIYARIPYGIIIIISGLMLILQLKNWDFKLISRMSYFLIVIALIAETSLSVYHVGIERNFISPTTKCQQQGLDDIYNPELKLHDIRDIISTIENTEVAPDCARPEMKILGFSLAELNFFLAVSLLFLTIYRKK